MFGHLQNDIDELQETKWPLFMKKLDSKTDDIVRQLLSSIDVKFYFLKIEQLRELKL